MTPGDECLPRFYTMHEINCRKCRRVMKIQVWYFKRKVLHYKNTETETSGEEKEIVAVAPASTASLERVLVKAGQVTSKPDTPIAIAIQREGQIEPRRPYTWP
ncbi:hypothetical protein K0M31_015900 [Melipona bicolor]|uniref:Uncharacterized protein n=1 Tax=Melipona bicolor TaxID=60889 RepID=A0AA40G615_9HYME|nr:hypothetical protein K0M31_015900 [Melipona bicolor]